MGPQEFLQQLEAAGHVPLSNADVSLGGAEFAAMIGPKAPGQVSGSLKSSMPAGDGPALAPASHDNILPTFKPPEIK